LLIVKFGVKLNVLILYNITHMFFPQKIQEMNQFIRENFRQKECQYFVPKKEQKPPAKYIQDLKLVVITSSILQITF